MADILPMAAVRVPTAAMLEEQVRRLATQPRKHSLRNQLFLDVRKPGRGAWTFRYIWAGKVRDFGLGAFPDVSLAEARALVIELQRKVRAGIDPKVERDAARLSARVETAKAVTVSQVFEQYYAAHHTSWRNAKHRQQWRNTFASYVMPKVGETPISAITTNDVLAILEPLWQSRLETASRLRGRLEVLLDYSSTRGWRSGPNPAQWRGHLDKLLPAPRALRRSKPVKHHAAAPYAEVPSILRRLANQAGNGVLALRFVILTAARSGEVRQASWDQIDLIKGVWTIPGLKMKGNREHKVPLSIAALLVLREVAERRVNNSPLLFPGMHGRPLSDMSLAASLKRLGRADITTHGFRSSFSTWAAEQTTHPAAVVEASLAHVTGDRVALAYQRSDLLDRRRQLLSDWGAFCAKG